MATISCSPTRVMVKSKVLEFLRTIRRLAWHRDLFEINLTPPASLCIKVKSQIWTKATVRALATTRPRVASVVSMSRLRTIRALSPRPTKAHLTRQWVTACASLTCSTSRYLQFNRLSPSSIISKTSSSTLQDSANLTTAAWRRYRLASHRDSCCLTGPP